MDIRLSARGCRLLQILLLCLTTLLPFSGVSAQAGDNIVITHPPAGAAIGNDTTVYFVQGEADLYEWQVTIGTTPEVTGLFNSGPRVFREVPWELSLNGLPSDGRSLTLRFWQRLQGGEWAYTDTVYSAGGGGVQIAESGGGAAASSKPATKAPKASRQTAQTTSKAATRAQATVQVNGGSTVSGLTAGHRNGQTFLTWVEVQGDVGYNVYRHNAVITSNNIASAEKLTAKWGPLDSDTSINKHAGDAVPSTYVISDLGQPLSESNGLFVYTPATNESAYYAVTTVSNGRENIALTSGENSLSAAVRETVGAPKPVLTVSLNKGKGRVYTQYMDYAGWNPTFNGYAYNYSITLPSGYSKRRSYPLLLRPHAYGEQMPVKPESEYGWQIIQIFPQDPGPKAGSTHSWWFGYSADHNYLTDGERPTSGKVANFTEERVMKAVRDTIEDPEINVDTQLVYAFGHSMGASGSLSLATRYGNVFAGMYGSEAMTDYTNIPQFEGEMEKLWGKQSARLPITIRGPYTDLITRYEGTGVWHWMNHHKQLVERRGDRMAYIMLAQGKADTIIDWYTQSAPMARVLNDASVGFSARFVADAGHSWLGFSAIVKSLFGFGNDTDFPWRYPRDLSFPAISYASGSGPLSPGLNGTDDYNMDIEWATPHTRFAKSIVDEPRRYEITLRSKSQAQSANITPRNTQRFSVRPGERCSWKAVSRRKTTGSGTVVVDADGLVTVPKVVITPRKGTRVTIQCA